MEKKILQATSNTPEVVLDPENNIYKISGESRPQDIHAFYRPILQWIDKFGQHINEHPDKSTPYDFNLSFEYFDSLSAKFILDICKNLSRLRSEGNEIKVRWYYEKDDIDMHEAGQQLSRISKLPFEYIVIDN
jgi:hypothetical protein